MRSLNKNRIDRFGRKQGHWEHYFPNGFICSKGVYKDNKREGIWEFYHDKNQLH